MDRAAAGDPAALYVNVLGTTYEIQAADLRQRAAIEREWSRCLTEKPSAGSVERVVATGPDVQAAGYALASRLSARGVHELRGRCIVLHACGLAGADGHVLVLVAPSGTGKTTAAIALADAGLGYVTDEIVAIEPGGRLVPYPKPVSIVDERRPGGPRVQQSPDDLGLGVPPASLRVGRVVVLDRDPGRSLPPRLAPLDLLDAVLELIPRTSSLAALPHPLQALLRLLTETGGAYRLTYEKISDATELLTTHLECRPTPAAAALAEAGSWTPLMEGVPTGEDLVWGLLDGRLRLKPHDDAVLVGEEALVLVSGVPVRIGGPALVVWQAARSAPTPTELHEDVLAALGPHPQAQEIVEGIVRELDRAGLLARGRPRPVSEIVAGI